MQVRTEQYIGGSWEPSTSSETIDVVNTSTEEIAGRVPAGSPADVDHAVAAAAEAFAEWSGTPVEARAAALERIHAGLEGHAARRSPRRSRRRWARR